MGNNSLGNILKVTSFGESHGAAVGCIIEGMPAGLTINIAAMQEAVNLRKTNQSAFASARNEEDTIEIISGVFENKTLGTPICILIKNTDAKSADYTNIATTYRPNHADYTTHAKYGIRDYRGGGRSSIRITAPLVAAGALALQLIEHIYADVNIQSYVYQIGNASMSEEEKASYYTDTQIFGSEVRCPSAKTTENILTEIATAKNNGDTLGGCIQTTITNLPVGIGEPIFAKLQSTLGAAMLSINTVKGFEYGEGFTASTKNGSQHNDEFAISNNTIHTKTNNSGGIQGGISNGMPIIFRTAFKPISSITKAQQTINENGDNIAIEIKGRHDVCAVPRAIPIVNAYTAIVLADLILQNKLSKI
jgi:chorismate synthase